MFASACVSECACTCACVGPRLMLNVFPSLFFFCSGSLRQAWVPWYKKSSPLIQRTPVSVIPEITGKSSCLFAIYMGSESWTLMLTRVPCAATASNTKLSPHHSFYFLSSLRQDLSTKSRLASDLWRPTCPSFPSAARKAHTTMPSSSICGRCLLSFMGFFHII